MSIEEALEQLDTIPTIGEQVDALEIAIKSLEAIYRINDVLNVEGVTEVDVLDEIVEAVEEFNSFCEEVQGDD